MQRAVSAGNHEAIEALALLGVFDQADTNGVTALMTAVHANDKNALTLLLKSPREGAVAPSFPVLNNKDRAGRTAVYFAASLGYPVVIKQLTDSVVDQRAKCDRGAAFTQRKKCGRA